MYGSSAAGFFYVRSTALYMRGVGRLKIIDLFEMQRYWIDCVMRREGTNAELDMILPSPPHSQIFM